VSEVDVLVTEASSVESGHRMSVPAGGGIQEDAHAAKIKLFKRQDMVFHKITLLFALIVLAGLFGILLSLAIEATPALKAFGFSFFGANVWSVPDDEFGARIAIYGTVVTSIIALVIAVPVDDELREEARREIAAAAAAGRALRPDEVAAGEPGPAPSDAGPA